MRTPRPEDHLRPEGERNLHTEYYESFLGHPIERPTPERRPRNALGSMDNIHLGDDGLVPINSLYVGLNDELICEPFPHPSKGSSYRFNINLNIT